MCEVCRRQFRSSAARPRSLLLINISGFHWQSPWVIAAIAEPFCLLLHPPFPLLAAIVLTNEDLHVQLEAIPECILVLVLQSCERDRGIEAR